MQKYLAVVSIALLLISCGTSNNGNNVTEEITKEEKTIEVENLTIDRPLPNPISYPLYYQNALKNGTRTENGKPSDSYWINRASYDIDLKLFTEEKKVEATQSVVYTNNSPDSLNALAVNILLNLHKEGAIRNELTETTGGVNLTKILLNGKELSDTVRQGARYRLNGTMLLVYTDEKVGPSSDVELGFEYNYTVPQAGASGRMGWSKDNFFYLGYFYPHVAVYDDVIGWHMDQFQGTAEFYADFADYNVSITAPGDWVVYGTGEFKNAMDILDPVIYKRMVEGHQSDSVVNVITEEDFGKATQAKADEWLTWKFESKNVRDVAYSLTKESNWDASRTPVGDLDGDGVTDYAAINSFWRSEAFRWEKQWKYAQHSIDFLSRYTGLKYPWPHMTSVEGAGIIGGGMEFPMMTIIGSYNRSTDRGLYGVTAHELAHMWVPMMVNNNERRYAWMDEGTTSYNENQATNEFYEINDAESGDKRSYMYVANYGAEGEIMRWSDYHYSGWAYGTASYSKPSTMLSTLKNMLGDELFHRAYREYLKRWQFKHPYPWDMFNSFEDVTGMDLEWFWRTWYYETWTLDQSIESVTITENGAEIEIKDLGDAPMPVLLEVEFEGGEKMTDKIDVKVWLGGSRITTYTVNNGKKVVGVKIDPEMKFPDLDPSNNVWVLEEMKETEE